MDKQTLSHPYNGILFSELKEVAASYETQGKECERKMPRNCMKEISLKRLHTACSNFMAFWKRQNGNIKKLSTYHGFR